ncbi:MAG: hypothetical protein JSU05_13455 [Bacteroidetes bacterium]|nr:hypothetical protein [Bacteroidota bacterium]
MRNIKHIFFLLFLIPAINAWSQEDVSFPLLKTIKGDIVSFAVDNLDNVYLLNSKDQLKKLDANGDSIAVFNNVKKYGKVTSIDVSNPLRVLLYYKDFATIVILDRFLNVRSTIDLRQQDIFQCNAICLAYDNGIWLYDEVNNKIKKLGDDGKLITETPDFRLLFGDAPTPVKIADEDKLVYLYDTVKGVYVFDYFGTLKNKILITGWNDFKVVGKYIFGVNNDTLHRYEINTFRVEDLPLKAPLYPAMYLDFTSTRLYALKKDALEIYQLK